MSEDQFFQGFFATRNSGCASRNLSKITSLGENFEKRAGNVDSDIDKEIKSYNDLSGKKIERVRAAAAKYVKAKSDNENALSNSGASVEQTQDKIINSFLGNTSDLDWKDVNKSLGTMAIGDEPIVKHFLPYLNKVIGDDEAIVKEAFAKLVFANHVSLVPGGDESVPTGAPAPSGPPASGPAPPAPPAPSGP